MRIMYEGVWRFYDGHKKVIALFMYSNFYLKKKDKNEKTEQIDDKELAFFVIFFHWIVENATLNYFFLSTFNEICFLLLKYKLELYD